ncbi:MAG: hypothetical protein KGI50_04615 [Patescibacteria group bacterium]|nr:hypothetical protein [Patescibacteria group bacterium]MDE2439250.1 hypothetical protein [Patescibacteria group bacterium]
MIAHRIPGRIRLRIPNLIDNKALANEIRGLLRSLFAVRDVTISILTGSVLIRYTPGTLAVDPLLSFLASYDAPETISAPRAPHPFSSFLFVMFLLFADEIFLYILFHYILA